MYCEKVCCFCESWESGGIESFLYNILINMDNTRSQVDIIVTKMGESIFTQPLKEHGIRFYELSGCRHSIIKNQKCLMMFLKENKYDVIHLNVFQGVSLRYLRIAQIAGIPIRIAHSHNTDLRQSSTRLLKMLLHRIAVNKYTQYATELWACSESAAKFMFSTAELSRRKYQFIPNGIDTKRFQFDAEERISVRKKLGLQDDLVIGNVGRLCYQKNQMFLLDVFAEVCRRHPQSRLLLVGDGETKEALMYKASRLKVSDKVIFYGVSDCVEKLFLAMDVFVFPSKFEGLGIVALEAQASGLPTICSSHVPDEACVMNKLCYKLSLLDGVKSWSDAILEGQRSQEQRASYAGLVREAGFDYRDVVRIVEKAYLTGVQSGTEKDNGYSSSL